jgi:hypothetical protein
VCNFSSKCELAKPVSKAGIDLSTKRIRKKKAIHNAVNDARQSTPQTPERGPERLMLLSLGSTTSLMLYHYYRVTVIVSHAHYVISPENNIDGTYAIIPPMATKTPRTDLSPTDRPDVAQPSATMVHVFKCPTTVLETGPVLAMMKN